MVTVTFILNTNVDALANWLKATWRPVFTTKIQLEALTDNFNRDSFGGRVSTRRLEAKGIFPYDRRPGNDTLVTVLTFELLSLSRERVEVRAGCKWYYALLRWFADLLSEMVKRWPELRDTLETNISPFVENYTQREALEAFAQRMQQLKVKPGQQRLWKRDLQQTLEDSPMVARKAKAVRSDVLAELLAGPPGHPSSKEPPIVNATPIASKLARDDQPAHDHQSAVIPSPNPLSKWNTESIDTIERMTNAGSSVVEIVANVPESEATVKRIRQELARQGRVKLKHRRVKLKP